MNIFLAYDDIDNTPQGIYIEGVHKNIPKSVIPLTDEDYQIYLQSDPSQIIVDVENSTIIISSHENNLKEPKNQPIPNSTLESKRSEGLELVDSYSNDVRIVSGTPLALQSLLYAEKTEEAIDFLLDPENNINHLENFPFIQLDAEIYNIDAAAAAKQILSQRKRWIKTNIEIERNRLQIKREIKEATDVKSIDLAIKKYKDFVQRFMSNRSASQ